MSFFNILKIELKKSFRSMLIMSLVLSLFLLMILLIFDPELFGGLGDMMALYPDAFLEMVGGMISLETLSGFINVEFLEMIWLWVGIYIILKVSQDIPSTIENKTIDLVLSKPIKRWEYALGKHIQYIITMFVVFLSMLLMIFVMVNVLPNLENEEIIWKEFIAAFFWAFLFCIALESTAFFLSTILPRKKATAIAFLILILFFIIGQFHELFDESIQWVRYFSLFNYYNPTIIMVGHMFTNVWRDFTILGVYSLIMTGNAIILFNKRDIPV